MNAISTILILLGILLAFLLFLAAITKGAYTIERDVIINRSLQDVFDYIKLMRNQEQYSVWVMKDPTNKIVYTGIDGTPGFLCTWEGEKQVGKGEQEITKVEEGKQTVVEIRFERPFKNTANTYMATKALGTNQTQITWQMVGKNKFPMTLFNLVIDSVLGKDMEKSLANIKRILEEK